MKRKTHKALAWSSLRPGRLEASALAWFFIFSAAGRADIINDFPANSYYAIRSAGGVGQTFIAVDREVSIASLDITALNPAFGPEDNLTFKIRIGASAGGSIIAEATSPFIPTGHDSWLNVVFDPAVKLLVGSTYTLWVDAATPRWGVAVDTGGHYDNGEAINTVGDLRFRILTAPLPGACCLNDGCLETVGTNTCAALGGTHAGNSTSCADDVCTPQACCTEFGCFTLTEFACLARDDWQDWLGMLGSCDETSFFECEPPLGACCVANVCVPDQTQFDCESVVGFWAGPLSDCTVCPLCTGPDFDGDGLTDNCDPDIDDDGVYNYYDICDFSPVGTEVTETGTFRGDLDRDCDVDLEDYKKVAEEFTGPLP